MSKLCRTELDSGTQEEMDPRKRVDFVFSIDAWNDVGVV